MVGISTKKEKKIPIYAFIYQERKQYKHTAERPITKTTYRVVLIQAPFGYETLNFVSLSLTTGLQYVLHTRRAVTPTTLNNKGTADNVQFMGVFGRGYACLPTLEVKKLCTISNVKKMFALKSKHF